MSEETTVEEIPEGNYSLTFFHDEDSSMQYSFGNISTNIASEWFYNYQDTVKIRSNWEVDLQKIQLNIKWDALYWQEGVALGFGLIVGILDQSSY